MKKLLVAGAMVAGAAVAARRCMAGCCTIDFEKLVERMPDGAPPKWMFRNISAIRENTEKILERLEAEPAQKPAPRRRPRKADAPDA
jgi:hypothetical protein